MSEVRGQHQRGTAWKLLWSYSFRLGFTRVFPTLPEDLGPRTSDVGNMKGSVSCLKT